MEVAVAASVLAVAILTAAASIVNLQDLSALAREKEMAVNDANRLLEAMRDAANDSLANLRNTDWSVWAVNNVISVKGTNELVLDQENAAVAIGDGNPAPVTLTLSWLHRQRLQRHQILSLMTDRG